ncbi:MAG: ABC transporter permease [Anaerolineae bacterium]
MASVSVNMSVPTLELKSPSEQRRIIRQFLKRRTAVLGLIIITLELLIIGLGPYFVGYEPEKAVMVDRFLPPNELHLMGTDDLGRDIFARVISGGRLSLGIGLFSVSLGMLIGVPLGLIAGYAGKTLDEIIMRFIDVLLSFPGILLAISIVAVLGPSLVNAVIAVAIFFVPVYARVVRGVTLSVKENTYILAAVSLGAGHARIILRHILPNVLAPIIVLLSLNLGLAIVSAAGLNFIGLGAKPPTPEWGLMLSAGRGYLRNEWWLATFPGLAIFFTVLGFNLIGDGLQDAFDPRMRKS